MKIGPGHPRRLFYSWRKADTPGCTTQSCGLRDVAEQIGDTAIIGISPDKPAVQKKFNTEGKFDRKFDGLVEMLAASGVLTRPPQPPAA